MIRFREIVSIPELNINDARAPLQLQERAFPAGEARKSLRSGTAESAALRTKNP